MVAKVVSYMVFFLLSSCTRIRINRIACTRTTRLSPCIYFHLSPIADYYRTNVILDFHHCVVVPTGFFHVAHRRRWSCASIFIIGFSTVPRCCIEQKILLCIINHNVYLWMLSVSIKRADLIFQFQAAIWSMLSLHTHTNERSTIQKRWMLHKWILNLFAWRDFLPWAGDNHFICHWSFPVLNAS